VRERVLDAGAQLASQALVARGLPPLPHVTPHAMRQTYVSIIVLATEFDLPFVQHQVRHADSKLTLDVYRQLLDRSKRAHGEAFDTLVADARTRCTARARAILAHYLAHRPTSGH
jgi:integrase